MFLSSYFYPPLHGILNCLGRSNHFCGFSTLLPAFFSHIEVFCLVVIAWGLLKYKNSIDGSFVICSFKESAGLFGSLLGLILLGRAAFVFPLSALSNYTTKSPTAKINFRQQV